MHHHMQEMRRLIEVDLDGVRIVGVHGMGGIGKTTIAKAIYNQLCDSFDGCCFLEDVREKAKQHPSGLVDLQKQLVFQILKKDFPDIVNTNDGIKKINDVVHKKKVLIVLDDVDKMSQFHMIAGECSWFNKASMIIVTTRNKEVLNALEATFSGRGLDEAYRSYEPELMTDGESLKLFSRYAFMRDSPPEDYLSLSRKVTSIAAGLPLVLVTLGSLFLGLNNKDRWIAKLKKLDKVPNKDVIGKLKISFDALDDDDKNVFLDIACFFIGKGKKKPSYMWEDCDFVPEDGVNTLVLRSLVKIGYDNKLRMHDQLRDLGRQIVREEYMYKLSRIWQPEEALNVLDGGLGRLVENVEAMNLDLTSLEFYEYKKIRDPIKQEYKKLRIEGKEFYIRRLKGQSFSRLQNLRYLQLGCVSLDKDFNHLFSNLRWLSWRCCAKSMPINLNLENLVILDLSNSTITDEWDGWTLLKAAKKLKVLNLSRCMGLIRGPNFSNFKDLESLVLNYCESLLEVSGIGQLESLTKLNMKGCKSILRLPNLSNLRRLRTLILEDCYMLNDIQGLQGLPSLEYLHLSGCHDIKKLIGLSNLKMLKLLVVYNCVNVCEKLHEIEGLSTLLSLESLVIRFCTALNINSLDLSICKNLKSIELCGLEHLKSLRELYVFNCNLLDELPDLSNLT